jgi:hypothetical protein
MNGVQLARWLADMPKHEPEVNAFCNLAAHCCCAALRTYIHMKDVKRCYALKTAAAPAEGAIAAVPTKKITLA